MQLTDRYTRLKKGVEHLIILRSTESNGAR